MPTVALAKVGKERVMIALLKKIIAAFICHALAAAPCAAWARDELIAVFSADIPPYRQAFDGFKAVVKGRQVRTLEHDLAKEGADGVARQIGEQRPLLVFAIGPEAAKFARERVGNVAVVYAMVLNTERLGGPHSTGVSLDIPVHAKLEAARRILPRAARVGVIYSPASSRLFKGAAQALRGLGMQSVGREVESGKELPEAFGKIVHQMDLILMIPDTKVYFPKSIEYLLVEALKNKVPVIGLAASYTRAGALISFEADYHDVGKQAGEMALRIMDGEKAGDIEPSRPRKIKSSLNLAVAERLGVKIDAQVIRETDEVFR